MVYRFLTEQRFERTIRTAKRRKNVGELENVGKLCFLKLEKKTVERDDKSERESGTKHTHTHS